MARLFKNVEQISAYKDRRFVGTQDEFEQALQTSSTVYVGNLSFYTTEEQMYELFSRCGEIKKIVMGLDKNSKTPCGFCFIIYYTREDTEDAVKYVSGTVLDDRPIRVDFDWGFQDGRQWGRGRSGGQVRDEYRTDYDPGRGGYGKLVQRDMESRRQLVDYTPGAGVMGAGPSFGGRNQPDGGTYGRNSGRDRKRRRDEESMPADGVKSSTDRDTRDKNPRFREKGDSDDEDAANAAASAGAGME